MRRHRCRFGATTTHLERTSEPAELPWYSSAVTHADSSEVPCDFEWWPAQVVAANGLADGGAYDPTVIPTPRAR